MKNNAQIDQKSIKKGGLEGVWADSGSQADPFCRDPYRTDIILAFCEACPGGVRIQIRIRSVGNPIERYEGPVKYTPQVSRSVGIPIERHTIVFKKNSQNL